MVVPIHGQELEAVLSDKQDRIDDVVDLGARSPIWEGDPGEA
jgi:hypothetical protein